MFGLFVGSWTSSLCRVTVCRPSSIGSNLSSFSCMTQPDSVLVPGDLQPIRSTNRDGVNLQKKVSFFLPQCRNSEPEPGNMNSAKWPRLDQIRFKPGLTLHPEKSLFFFSGNSSYANLCWLLIGPSQCVLCSGVKMWLPVRWAWSSICQWCSVTAGKPHLVKPTVNAEQQEDGDMSADRKTETSGRE